MGFALSKQASKDQVKRLAALSVGAGLANLGYAMIYRRRVLGHVRLPQGGLRLPKAS